ncbi:MAG: methyltransferase domain-containing protein [Verrucomicrobiales bacterium]|nr:methyltransferase domain-containing protein [Verrucomicrobiales bacterium]
MQLAWGYAPVLVIGAAVEHGVFDQLADGPKTRAGLVAATGASDRGLRILLDALVGQSLLQREGEHYTLTAESAAFLVRGRPGYRGGFFLHHSTQLLPQWMELTQVVRTGKPTARTNRETDGGAHFAGFVESLFPGSYPAAKALAAHLQLAEATTPVSVVDLGAGSGVWGIALAEASSQVLVRAVDWPEVLEITRQIAKRHQLEDRLTCVPGDLFQADYGQDHHVAILGHILHSEGPDRIRQLLARTFAALRPGGVLAIQEFLPNDERTGPPLPLLFAVNMLVNTEAGGTYTFAEISGWLAEVGFVRPRLLEVPAVSPLILADKPGA